MHSGSIRVCSGDRQLRQYVPHDVLRHSALLSAMLDSQTWKETGRRSITLTFICSTALGAVLDYLCSLSPNVDQHQRIPFALSPDIAMEVLVAADFLLIPALKELAAQYLASNMMYIDDFGDLPAALVDLVLDKANPPSLFRAEHLLRKSRKRAKTQPLWAKLSSEDTSNLPLKKLRSLVLEKWVNEFLKNMGTTLSELELDQLVGFQGYAHQLKLFSLQQFQALEQYFPLFSWIQVVDLSNCNLGPKEAKSVVQLLHLNKSVSEESESAERTLVYLDLADTSISKDGIRLLLGSHFTSRTKRDTRSTKSAPVSAREISDRPDCVSDVIPSSTSARYPPSRATSAVYFQPSTADLSVKGVERNALRQSRNGVEMVRDGARMSPRRPTDPNTKTSTIRREIMRVERDIDSIKRRREKAIPPPISVEADSTSTSNFRLPVIQDHRAKAQMTPSSRLIPVDFSLPQIKSPMSARGPQERAEMACNPDVPRLPLETMRQSNENEASYSQRATQDENSTIVASHQNKKSDDTNLMSGPQSIYLDLSRNGALGDSFLLEAQSASVDMRSLVYLNLSNNYLGFDGSLAICDFLRMKRCQLRVLLVGNCQLTLPGIMNILKAITGNRILEILDIGHNICDTDDVPYMGFESLSRFICSTDAIKSVCVSGTSSRSMLGNSLHELASALQSNRSIKRLHLRSCHAFSGNNLDHLVKALLGSQSLKSLVLSCNEDAPIDDFLNKLTNCRLTYLDLSFCHYTPNTWFSVCSLVDRCMHLRHLHLDASPDAGGKIGDEGFRNLLQSLPCGKGLKCLRLGHQDIRHPSCIVFAELLPTLGLQNVSLRGNRIGILGARRLGVAIGMYEKEFCRLEGSETLRRSLLSMSKILHEDESEICQVGLGRQRHCQSCFQDGQRFGARKKDTTRLKEVKEGMIRRDNDDPGADADADIDDSDDGHSDVDNGDDGGVQVDGEFVFLLDLQETGLSRGGIESLRDYAEGGGTRYVRVLLPERGVEEGSTGP